MPVPRNPPRAPRLKTSEGFTQRPLCNSRVAVKRTTFDCRTTPRDRCRVWTKAGLPPSNPSVDPPLCPGTSAFPSDQALLCFRFAHGSSVFALRCCAFRLYTWFGRLHFARRVSLLSRVVVGELRLAPCQCPNKSSVLTPRNKPSSLKETEA